MNLLHVVIIHDKGSINRLSIIHWTKLLKGLHYVYAAYRCTHRFFCIMSPRFLLSCHGLRYDIIHLNSSCRSNQMTFWFKLKFGWLLIRCNFSAFRFRNNFFRMIQPKFFCGISKSLQIWLSFQFNFFSWEMFDYNPVDKCV